MPTYDYSCRSCGARFEAWQKMTDDPITICPTCGGPVHRVIYPVGLVFKGSGFYITDNSKASANGANGHATDAPTATQKDEAKAASAPADTGSSNGSGAEAKTETKAAPAASAASTPAAGAAKE